MGVMTKMRENTGTVLWILVIAFGGLWVLQDSGAFQTIGLGQTQYIGRVNGQDVGYEEYQNAVDQQLNVYQQQGIEISPALQSQIEDEVWDAMVANALREQEMKRLGIDVSREEVYELITGPNPAPIIQELFPDGQGGVDRTRLGDVIAAADENTPEGEQLRAQLVTLEEEIARQRRQEKLDALITATVRVTPSEVDRELRRQTRRATAQFVALRYADVPESNVEISESEVDDYYDAHRDDYRRPETYTAEYVRFSKAPSPADLAQTTGEMQALRSEIATGDSLATIAAENGFQYQADTTFATPDQLDPELSDALFSNPTPGSVVGPMTLGNEVVMVRILENRPSQNRYIRARHILLSPEQEQMAREIKQRIITGDMGFADAASVVSLDEGNKAQGGDLGWFTEGAMVEPFWVAASEAPLGEVIGPVQTQFGHHLIRVDDETSTELKFIRVSKLVSPSRDAREAASEFQFFTSDEGRDFREAAESEGLVVATVEAQAEQSSIAEVNVGREAFSFFETASAGDLSDPVDAGDDFVIFHLVDKQEEGSIPLDEVRGQIEAELLNEKRKAVQVAALETAREQSGGNLETLAQTVGEDVGSFQGLTMTTPSVPGYGQEPRVVGAAFGLQPGGSSGVIEGQAAAFVVQTTEFTDESEAVDGQREQVRRQLLQQKRQAVLQAWIEDLREKAEVEDLRSQVLYGQGPVAPVGGSF